MSVGEILLRLSVSVHFLIDARRITHMIPFHALLEQIRTHFRMHTHTLARKGRIQTYPFFRNQMYYKPNVQRKLKF